VILIPGGFKPPTNGHYSMIKHYEDRADVSKVVVVTGFKPRKEPDLTVTHEQSKAIFELYGGFSDKVEFRDQGSWATPMTTCYELVKDEKFVSEFQGAVFAMGASDKDDDKKRIGAFFNYFQKNPARTRAQVVNFPPAKAFEVDGKAASATRMRKAFTAGDWETFKKLLPHESFYDDVVQILNNQGVGRVNENFLLAVPQSFLVEGQKKKKISVERKTGHINEVPIPGIGQGDATPTEIKAAEDSQKVTNFRIDLQKMLKDLSRDLGLGEMDASTRKEFTNSTVATLTSLLLPTSRVATTGVATEASGMAGGGMAGGGGESAWLSKRDDKTLIGEEDDE